MGLRSWVTLRGDRRRQRDRPGRLVEPLERRTFLCAVGAPNLHALGGAWADLWATSHRGGGGADANATHAPDASTAPATAAAANKTSAVPAKKTTKATKPASASAPPRGAAAPSTVPWSALVTRSTPTPTTPTIPTSPTSPTATAPTVHASPATPTPTPTPARHVNASTAAAAVEPGTGEDVWDSHVIPPTPVPNATPDPSVAPLLSNVGEKKVLYIRVAYADTPTTEPETLTSATNVMNSVDAFVRANSFGQAWFTTTITDLIVLPKTKAQYTTAPNDDFTLRADALAAAKAAGIAAGKDWDYVNYATDAVRFSGGPGGYSGQGYVGTRGVWLKATNAGVAAHEFGHNFGAWHANYLVPSNPQTVVGPGANEEYGDPYDTMGDAYANHHFSNYHKNLFGWIPGTAITTASADGTYRLHADDLGGPLTAGASYGIKVRKDADRDMWLEYRQNARWSGNRWVMSGVTLRWDDWGVIGDKANGSNRGTSLIDTTPSSKDGKSDAPIAVGRTFSDPVAGIHITPIAEGTDAALGGLPYVDVRVAFGNPAGNDAPAIADLNASATSVATGGNVNFTAAATDANGDALAYEWDFGDRTFGANAAAVSKNWSAAGVYRVRLTVSDMRGRTTSASRLITVGAPSAAANVISGRVTDAYGNPVPDVRVHNGLATADANFRSVYTDADGTYTLAGLPSSGSYTIAATRAGWTFARRAFANPVTAGGNPSAVDFVGAAPAVYKITGKVTADGTAPVAGATVSDGTRTEATDASGNYTLFVPPGNHTLTVTRAGFTFAQQSVIVEFADVTRNVTAQTASVSGVITGLQANQVVTVGTGAKSVTVTVPASATSVSYSLQGLPLGRVNVWATSPGYRLAPNGWSSPLTLTGSTSGRNFLATAATAYTVSGRVTDRGQPAPFVTVSNGTVTSSTDSLGYYALTGLAPGSYTLTPSGGGGGGVFTPASTSVTVSTADLAGRNFAAAGDAPPTAAAGATAAVASTGLVADLSVLGADDGGEAFLTYTWSVASAPAGGAATFSINGNRAAKATTAAFDRVGTYVLRATIRDGGGNTAASDVTVDVDPLPRSLVIAPADATAALGGTLQFTATSVDQFGAAVANQPNLAWSVSGGGAIDAGGLFTPATLGGPYVVTAEASNGMTATTTVYVAHPAGPGTGVLRQWWTGVSGGAVANLTASPNYPDNPTGSAIIDPEDGGGLFEAPSSFGDSYGTRMRGYFVPPVSGSYRFYVAADDQAQLWLSTDADPANAAKVAELTTATAEREWTRWASQRSASIALAAGRRYYIEALHKDGSGSDHLAVGVDLPGGVTERPIPTHRLEPWGRPTLAAVTNAAVNAVGTGVNLHALGADDGGEAGLDYAWSVVSAPAGAPAVTFSGNFDNAAKATTATVGAPGAYTFRVAIDDGATTFTDTVSVTVAAVASAVTLAASPEVAPAGRPLAPGQARAFAAVVRDQFGTAVAPQPGLAWSVTGGGGGGGGAGGNAVSGAGVVTAGTTPGDYVVTATAGALSGTAAFTVVPAPSADGLVVDDGTSPQRSMVRSLTVAFDRAVVLAQGALTLTGPGGAAVGITAVPAPGEASVSSGAARQYLLSFDGSLLGGGSIADGVYTLAIRAANVADDATGAALTADRSYAFHRLFSDVDGDGDSDSADLSQFRQALNKSASLHPADYKWYLDYDDNGVIDGVDLAQSRSRRSVVYTY